MSIIATQNILGGNADAVRPGTSDVAANYAFSVASKNFDSYTDANLLAPSTQPLAKNWQAPSNYAPDATAQYVWENVPVITDKGAAGEEVRGVMDGGETYDPNITEGGPGDTNLGQVGKVVAGEVDAVGDYVLHPAAGADSSTVSSIKVGSGAEVETSGEAVKADPGFSEEDPYSIDLNDGEVTFSTPLASYEGAAGAITAATEKEALIYPPAKDNKGSSAGSADSLDGEVKGVTSLGNYEKKEKSVKSGGKNQQSTADVVAQMTSFKSAKTTYKKSTAKVHTSLYPPTASWKKPKKGF